MLRLSRLFLRCLLLLCVLAFLALFAVRHLSESMGATTIADGYRQLRTSAPDWSQQLFSAPWWVPAAAAALPALLLVWPRRKRRRKVKPKPDAETVAAKPAAFEKAPKPPPPPYLKEEHIYAGSAKLGMPPEFRAIPVRRIAKAEVFIDYSAYSAEDGRWDDVRRIFVAEVRDQEPGEWSVVNVELMTRYETGSGGVTWRWAHEFDYGPPDDEDYRFAHGDHYQGRVVFVAPDGTATHCYFAIEPSSGSSSEMPTLIGRNLFDFVEEWEAQDREEALTI